MIASLLTPVGLGIGCVALATAIVVYLVLGPRPVRLPVERRRGPGATPESLLSRGATAATDTVGAFLSTRMPSTDQSLLQQAGVKMRFQDFAFLCCVGMLVAFAVGLLLGQPIAGGLLAVAVPVVARVVLGILKSRRRTAFSDQLDDSLQLMASSLRAGHSLLQALDSVAREAEEPTSEEFSRIMNETRLGRDLPAAMNETAERMGSEDFVWVTQAVAINRDVGGNLAEVLDGVAHTIRQRGEIRRQVKALAAEGKLSAIILMLLPFFVLGFLAVVNPGYLMGFTESIVGYGMLATAVVLLVGGGIWMRNVIRIKF